MDNDAELSSKIIKELKNRVNKFEYVMDRDTQIKYIIEEIDFEKIHKTMVFLKWTWFTAGSITPNIDELRTYSIKLLKNVWDSEEGIPVVSIGTGGLVATRQIYEGMKTLSLQFDISNWGFDNDDIQCPNYNDAY